MSAYNLITKEFFVKVTKDEFKQDKIDGVLVGNISSLIETNTYD